MNVTFGDKLLMLRKQKGFSQEALAEKLDSTRQAISKWENGQGYPETDKLIMMGHTFEVSIDYLVKDSVEENVEDQEGYYVSREMAEGFLLSTRKFAHYVSLGFALFALALDPYFIFEKNTAFELFLMIVIGTLGVIAFVSAGIGFDEGRYKILKREVLLLDSNFLKELTVRYEDIKKKYLVIMVPGVCLLAVGVLAFGLEKKLDTGILAPYYPIFVVLIAIGLYILGRTLTVISAYQLLVKNEEHTNRFGFKLREKVRKKFDDL